jgi:hypothetical protein
MANCGQIIPIRVKTAAQPKHGPGRRSSGKPGPLLLLRHGRSTRRNAEEKLGYPYSFNATPIHFDFSRLWVPPPPEKRAAAWQRMKMLAPLVAHSAISDFRQSLELRDRVL